MLTQRPYKGQPVEVTKRGELKGELVRVEEIYVPRGYSPGYYDDPADPLFAPPALSSYTIRATLSGGRGADLSVKDVTEIDPRLNKLDPIIADAFDLREQLLATKERGSYALIPGSVERILQSYDRSRSAAAKIVQSINKKDHALTQNAGKMFAAAEGLRAVFLSTPYTREFLGGSKETENIISLSAKAEKALKIFDAVANDTGYGEWYQRYYS